MGAHLHCGGLSAFSALHLLRSYNHLLAPTASDLGPTYHPLLLTPGVAAPSYPPVSPDYVSPLRGCSPYTPILPLVPVPPADKRVRQASGGTVNGNNKRPRGEKKPIPEELKDEKYYERRKRNNQAAKKSRDARKLREDQIALRAAYLEEERAIHRSQEQLLRAQVQSLSRQVQLLTAQVQTLGEEKETLSKQMQATRLAFKITSEEEAT